MKSKRFEVLSQRPVNQDGYVKEWVEEGFIAMESPQDPKPSLKIEGGRIVELDSKRREDFDLIDTFIANYGIVLDGAQEAMAKDSKEIANMMLTPSVPREEIVKICKSITPAKMLEVVSTMNVVEMMQCMQKMRARRTMANQAHVTNVNDNPVQIAADAAEGALRGFAPLNAISLLVGSQCGRPGVLTQCSLEEATELELGMRGFTAYAETISVYGTEDVFTDGDDTPWSKGFLASAYASRGLKMRFTSGTGSEVQMGQAEGKSMLYLEIRCLYITKGAGVQGIQNGSVSCIGIPAAVPSGIRAVLAENLVAAMLDLECASSNDQTFSHSDLRRTARTLMQFAPGTDFICSGYSSTPNYDNMFAGSNWDAEDYDDWNIIQRDLKIDAGLRPVREEEVIKVRNKAARAIQAVFDALGFPEITDEEVEAATYAHGSKDIPERDMVADMKAASEMMERGITGIDIVKALKSKGFDDLADSLLKLMKLRVSGDHLHTSAILDKDFNVISAVNDRNDYTGPGTGYQISAERWAELSDIQNAADASKIK